MKNYAVGIKIYNLFYIGAESKEEAEQKVRELDPYETLKDCDFNIEYVDEYEAGEECWKLTEEDLSVKDGDYSIQINDKSNG